MKSAKCLKIKSLQEMQACPAGTSRVLGELFSSESRCLPLHRIARFRLKLSKIIFLAIISLVSLHNSSFSQASYQTIRKTQEAKELMEAGEFQVAYQSFRKILSSGQVLPTNLSYYFAETLYHVGQYQNSKNFLDKYLKITGKGGDHYRESLLLSKLLKAEFDKISNCEFCDETGYKLTTCIYCDGQKSLTEPCRSCGHRGITICKKCNKEGVIIITDVFGKQNYQTCDRCKGKGVHICDTCYGSKTLLLNCSTCLGTGIEKSKVLCDHNESTSSY